MDLSVIPVPVLADMLDSARAADDQGLVLLYAEALEAHAHGLTDCYFPEARAKQRPPEGDWSIWMILSGRGFGKELCSHTMIPTPDGWREIGDLATGDVVFDERGRPTTVLATFDRTPESAYRVTFQDGTSLDAGADHQWVTWTHADRKSWNRSPSRVGHVGFPDDWPTWRSGSKYGPRRGKMGPRVRTTAEIIETQTYGKRGDRNHCVPLAGALQLPDADLPVDPWALGYWLGNGRLVAGSVSTHPDDQAGVREQYARAGYECGLKHNENRAPSFSVYGLVHGLRAAGVLGNKHVPRVYFRASEQQRRALLAGLLDSDGYCDPTNGSLEFSSTTEALADAVVELARSLGEKPVSAKGIAKLYGVEKGPKWRVTWHPRRSPFALPRKAAALLAFDRPQHLRNHHRMIVSVEPITPKPMRCITVDSPHSLYLAGEGMIPTHNTRTGAEWIVDQALARPLTTWAILAPTFRDARAICMEGRGEQFKPSGVLSVLARRGIEPKSWNKSLGELRLQNDSLILLLSAEQPDRTRGYNLAGAWADELATFPYEDAWDFLQFALRTGENPQIVVTTTPRPMNLVRRLVEREGNGVVVTRGTTYENAANLSPKALAEWESQYAGTRLGAQELHGEILDLGGELIDPSWFKIVQGAPAYPRKVRSWDLAGSVPSAMNEDPDWSVGALVSYQPEQTPYTVADGTEIHAGAFCIEDVIRLRETPAQVELAVLNAARRDGPGVKVVIEREPGQSGLSQLDHFRQVLQGVALVEEFRPSGPKEVRAQLVATAAQQGRVEVVSAEWREWFYDECRSFPYGKHDDGVDAVSAAFAALEGRGGMASAQAPTGRLPGRDSQFGQRDVAGIRRGY